MKDSTQASIDQWDRPGFADTINRIRATMGYNPISRDQWVLLCNRTHKLLALADKFVENIETEIDIKDKKDWFKNQVIMLALDSRYLED